MCVHANAIIVLRWLSSLAWSVLDPQLRETVCFKMHMATLSQKKQLSIAAINLLVYGSDVKTIRHLLMIGSSLAANTVHHNSRSNLTPVFRSSRLGTFVDGKNQ